MVMREPSKNSSRNLLPYFMECKVWKSYESNIVNNYLYWNLEDPVRASRMFNSGYKKKGYTVQEYLYDMVACIYASPFNQKTKSKLYSEIDEVEQWHEHAGTIMEQM